MSKKKEKKEKGYRYLGEQKANFQRNYFGFKNMLTFEKSEKIIATTKHLRTKTDSTVALEYQGTLLKSNPI